MIIQDAWGILHPVAGAGPAYLVFDSMTGANATLLPDHPLDVDTVGGGWFVPAGDLSAGSEIEIQSNRAAVKTQTAFNTALVLVDSGVSDGIVAVFLSFTGIDLAGGSGAIGLALRAQDGDNFISATFFAIENGGGTYNVDVALTRYIAGSGVQLDAASMVGVAQADLDAITLEATLAGDDIGMTATFGLNSLNVAATSATFASETNHGLQWVQLFGLVAPLGVMDDFSVI